MEERRAAFEAEIHTAVIEEKTVPIFLGVRSGATLPSVFHHLIPEAEEGWVYWEWAEVSRGGERKVVQTAYGQLLPGGGLEFPFAKELDVSRMYIGVGIHLSFFYKKPTGEWIGRVVVPGMLSFKAREKKFNLKEPEAFRYADEDIQLIDAELIPPARRAAFIVYTFEMILLP